MKTIYISPICTHVELKEFSALCSGDMVSNNTNDPTAPSDPVGPPSNVVGRKLYA